MPAGWFMIRNRTRVSKAPPGGRLVSLIATGKNPKIDLLLAKRPPRTDWKPNRANFWEARPVLFVCLLSPEVLEPR
jgi:hypothetical protein